MGVLYGSGSTKIRIQMSDPVKCEKCGQTGPRRMGRPAPEGWYFIEAVDEEDPEMVFLIYACSVACRDGLWQLGPGPRMNLALPEKG